VLGTFFAFRHALDLTDEEEAALLPARKRAGSKRDRRCSTGQNPGSSYKPRTSGATRHRGAERRFEHRCSSGVTAVWRGLPRRECRRSTTERARRAPRSLRRRSIRHCQQSDRGYRPGYSGPARSWLRTWCTLCRNRRRGSGQYRESSVEEAVCCERVSGMELGKSGFWGSDGKMDPFPAVGLSKRLLLRLFFECRYCRGG
jgi:hypothetical protein